MDTSIDTKAIEAFNQSPINQDLVHLVIVRTLQIIPCDKDSANAINDNKRLPSLLKFLNRLIQALRLNNGIFMSTIIYLNRLKAKLPENCKGLPSTRHRILLSCLILSIKFNNDFSLKNHDWLKLTNRLFNLKDINLMERQLLYLLDWNLFVNEFEIFHHFNKFLAPIKDDLMDKMNMNKYISSLESPKSSCPQTPTSRSPSFKSFSPNPSCYSSTPSPVLSQYDRKASSSSLGSVSHYRRDSDSSVDSIALEPINTHIKNVFPTAVNPLIELTTLNEQYALNKMLESFQRSTI